MSHFEWWNSFLEWLFHFIFALMTPHLYQYFDLPVFQIVAIVVSMWVYHIMILICWVPFDKFSSHSEICEGLLQEAHHLKKKIKNQSRLCSRRLYYVVKAWLTEDDIQIIDLHSQAGLGSRETQPRGTENAAPQGGGRQHFWKVVAPAESSRIATGKRGPVLDWMCF